MREILVIDDEPLVRTTVRAMLERGGNIVLEADNGREGELKFAAHPTDLVIIDILMPEQEGIETIRNLRRSHPAIKILAMSGGGRTGNQEFLAIAQKFGAAAVLAKPFTRAQLIQAVDRACGGDASSGKN